MGFWNKQHDYMDDFQTEKWDRLSAKERLNHLQSLENDMAAEQGRKARKVTPKQCDCCGSYDWENPNKLYINQSYLESRVPGEQYDAMDTVIHEGRHAYQHDCIEGKIKNPPESQDTISTWSKNRPDEIYNTDDFSRYRFQPIEADANDYANDKMASYKDKFDKDFNYKSYMDSINAAKQDDIDKAAKRLDTKPDEKEIKNKISNEINNDYAWNHRYIPTREEQDQAFSKLCEYGEKHYGEDWRQMSGDIATKDSEFRNLYQTAFPDYRLPPMEKASATTKDAQVFSQQNGSVTSTENSQRGSLPTQNEADSDINKKSSSIESKPQNQGVERGKKPVEDENKAQGSNSTPRGERPQEASQTASNAPQTQRGTPPGSTGGEDSKAPTSASSNPSDKISASSNSAKAADEASKVASERAAQSATPRTNGMNM